LISAFTRWTAKPRHIALESRPGPTSDEWGKSGNEQWAIHLLQGFRGIGPVQARAIYEHFDRTVPAMWTVGLSDLMEVRGIGAKRARVLWESLDNAGSTTEDWTKTAMELSDLDPSTD
jgi:ERCC4-type nuclease